MTDQLNKIFEMKEHNAVFDALHVGLWPLIKNVPGKILQETIDNYLNTDLGIRRLEFPWFEVIDEVKFAIWVEKEAISNVTYR